MRVFASGWPAVVLVAALSGVALGQASALPSAQAGPESATTASSELSQGRKLLNQMIAALGGETWLHRENWVYEGKAATFYKGQPHEGAPGFIEYYRARPFAERVQIISQYGLLIATEHKDIVDIWTADSGYELTYKGKNPLPAKDVAEHERRQRHSLEVVVNEWLQQPGVLVTYEGTNMVERRLADQVSVLTANNDAVTLELDEATHLPLSLSYQWRDPVYKDVNTDTEEFDDYHPVQGMMTAYSITSLHNGEMIAQRFLTKAAYNQKLPAEFFDPDGPLPKKK